MPNSKALVIRHDTVADEKTLRHLAAIDSQSALTGPALIGEIGGVALAAIDLASGRVVANPFHRTAALTDHLRIRREGMNVAAPVPSLRERIRARIRLYPRTSVASHA